MAIRKQTKCSVCGQAISTLAGALFMTDAPVVCRRCFGHQTYKVPGERASSSVSDNAGGTG